MKKSTAAIILSLLGFGVSESRSFAQLSWDTKQLTFEPKAEEEHIVGEFKFTNKGNNTLTFLSIKTSCGCTTAELPKKIYAPGESGVVKANFDIRHRSGFQQKNILIETDDLREPMTQLTIEANIEPLVIVEPAKVSWTVGEQNEPRVVTLKPNPKVNLSILDAKSTNYSIFPQLEAVAPGKEYRLRITPKSTNARSKATIILLTDYPKDNPREIDIKAEIN